MKTNWGSVKPYIEWFFILLLLKKKKKEIIITNIPREYITFFDNLENILHSMRDVIHVKERVM